MYPHEFVTLEVENINPNITKLNQRKDMSTIGAAAACSACSTLAEYEETNKATAAPQETEDAKQNRKFDWQKNSENLRSLANTRQNEADQNKDIRSVD